MDKVIYRGCFALGDALAEPAYARLLPCPQLLPLPPRRHARRRHQLSWIHLGNILIYIYNEPLGNTGKILGLKKPKRPSADPACKTDEGYNGGFVGVGREEVSFKDAAASKKP